MVPQKKSNTKLKLKLNKKKIKKKDDGNIRVIITLRNSLNAHHVSTHILTYNLITIIIIFCVYVCECISGAIIKQAILGFD